MDRIDRYATLITRVGANVQPGQSVFVTALVEHAPLVRALARAGYEAGAKRVDVRYVDKHVKHAQIELADDDVLTETTPCADHASACCRQVTNWSTTLVCSYSRARSATRIAPRCSP